MTDLLEQIPTEQLEPKQVAHWRGGETSPTYKLTREPTTWSEFELAYGSNIAIWRENGTLTYVSTGIHTPDHNYARKSHYFTCRFFSCVIVGWTDEAIAETVALFWSLTTPNEPFCDMDIYNYRSEFNFNVIRPEQFAVLFDADPKRRIRFHSLDLSARHSVALATRPDPIEVEFGEDCVFEDGGEAFVKALETRHSSFGSLAFERFLPLANRNLKRFFQVKTIEKLEVPHLLYNDFSMLPFSAPVKTLDYSISSGTVFPEEMRSVDIVTKELVLRICRYVEDTDFPWDLMLSIFCRVTDIGHFKKLSFLSEGISELRDDVGRELIRAVKANQQLEYLDLGLVLLCAGDYCKDFFKVLEGHKGLRTLRLDIDDEALPWLQQLLHRNTNIIAKSSSNGKVINPDD